MDSAAPFAEGKNVESVPDAYVDADVSGILDETTAASVGYTLVPIRGVPQNPLFDVAKCEALIDSFEGRASDVFVCTYVKAGTTWTQQIVTLLLNGGEQGAASYGERVPWLEATCAGSPLPEREAPGWTLDAVNASSAPRFFKTHATVAQLPGRAAAPRVIAVARNPKDTAVSLYHHARSKPDFGYSGDFETFLRVFLSGHAENGSWFEHVVEWHAYATKHPDRCVWLTYEDMIRDPRAAVVAIARFLGLLGRDGATEADDAALVDKTVANSTMRSMQENAKANIGLNHLRKGGVGGWRDTFTVSQSQLFDKVYAAKMQGYGLTFDFGDGEYM